MLCLQSYADDEIHDTKELKFKLKNAVYVVLTSGVIDFIEDKCR